VAVLSHPVTRGTVKTWHDDEGWGVLVSPEAPYPEGQDEDDGVVYYYRATRVREIRPQR
jgi:hypothetical protein